MISGDICNGGRSAMVFQHHCRSSGGKVCNGGEGLQYNTGTGQRLALHVFLVRRFFPQVTYFHFAYTIGGRPFDSEGGGWHFVEINILTLKMLKINNLSSSVKKTNNLTLTFLQFTIQLGGGGVANFSHILLPASLATS